MDVDPCTYALTNTTYSLIFLLDYINGEVPKQTNPEFQTIASRRIEVDLKGEPIGVAASFNGLFIAVVEL